MGEDDFLDSLLPGPDPYDPTPAVVQVMNASTPVADYQLGAFGQPPCLCVPGVCFPDCPACRPTWEGERQ